MIGVGTTPAAHGKISRKVFRDASSEAAIQRGVVEHLRLCGVPGLVWYHPANGGGRSSKAEAAKLKREGVTPGIPDLMLHHAGRSYGLELKAANGRLSPEQRDMHQRLVAAGVEVAVANGVDAALRQLRNWELLK